MLKKILGTIGSRYLIAFLNLALIFINAKVLGIEGVGMIGLIVASVNIAVIVNVILCGNTIVYFMNRYSMRTIFLPAYLWTPIGSSLACGFMYLTGLLPTGYRLDIFLLAILSSTVNAMPASCWVKTISKGLISRLYCKEDCYFSSYSISIIY